MTPLDRKVLEAALGDSASCGKEGPVEKPDPNE